MSVEITNEALDAYNLTVEGYHTYFVAGELDAEPVWVHNNKTCGPKIVTQDGDVFEYSMTGGSGDKITVITGQRKVGDQLVLDGLHIDGAGAGSSNASELRGFARSLGQQHGFSQVIIDATYNGSKYWSHTEGYCY